MSGRKGQMKRAPMRSGKGRMRMWQSMRVLRAFTVADVMATAEAGQSAATKYVRFLHRAGYLRCVRPLDSGRTGGHARYQLVRDTGPFAPRIGKQGVHDPNLARVQSEPTVTIPRSEYARALRCIKLCEAIRATGASSNVQRRATNALEVAR